MRKIGRVSLGLLSKSVYIGALGFIGTYLPNVAVWESGGLGCGLIGTIDVNR